MTEKILFVWDFHGVLEKGNVHAVCDLVNLVLKDFGVNKEITLKETIDWYGLSWFDYFKLAAPDKERRTWEEMVSRVLIVQKESWEAVTKKHLKSRDFVQEVLGEIKSKGHDNIILSNTQPEHIRTFVDLINISHYFNDIIGVDQHHKTRLKKEVHNIKAKNLREYLKEKEYAKIVMIGDRESDILAGKSCGAVTYLFIDKEINPHLITDMTSDFTIFDLREVLKEI